MKTYIVDSFTNEPFKGNPAAVCILDQSLDEEQMQLIAKELGLSETAFIQHKDKEEYFSIRYFSPKMEIPLCGHATLAASKVLFDEFEYNNIVFKNIQEINIEASNNYGRIQIDFPQYISLPETVPNNLLRALSIEKVMNTEYNAETNIILIEIESSEFLKGMKPNFQELFDSTKKYNGVLVTAKSEDNIYDYHSRYFWPWSGTFEDPVTGGAQTFLAPYWSKRLKKNNLKCFQSSLRTGYMDVELLGDKAIRITGDAVIVFKGIFLA